MTNRISCARIEEAYSVIDSRFLDSPQVTFESLNSVIDAKLTLKVETLNPIRSFKGRGANYYVQRAVHLLKDRRPLVVSSVGNFGQAIAQAAAVEELPVTVFVPHETDAATLGRISAFGARIERDGKDLDEAKQIAKHHASASGQRFVEDGFDAALSEGAGTIALELLRSASDYDEILIPLGGGSILNGMGTWIKAYAPETQVVGVCARGAPSMANSWLSGSRKCTEDTKTIAGGLAIRSPVQRALEDMRQTVDDVLLVDDEMMLSAMHQLLMHSGLLIEPSGAVGVAAVLANRERFTGKRLATPLCGGNITPSQFRDWFSSADQASAG